MSKLTGAKRHILGYEKGRLTRYVAEVDADGAFVIWRQCRYGYNERLAGGNWHGGHGDVKLTRTQLRKLCAIVAATPESR